MATCFSEAVSCRPVHSCNRNASTLSLGATVSTLSVLAEGRCVDQDTMLVGMSKDNIDHGSLQQLCQLYFRQIVICGCGHSHVLFLFCTPSLTPINVNCTILVCTCKRHFCAI